MNAAPIILLKNGTQNIATPSFQALPGGDYEVFVTGAYGTATLRIRFSADGTTAAPPDTNFTFTADTPPFIFTAGEGGSVGVDISNKSAPTNLTVILLPVPK